MGTTKIAITIPPPFLKRLDQWAKKRGKSRSRFIVDELDKRLKEMEDEEITRLYDAVSEDPVTRAYDQELAEELLAVAAEAEEKW